MANAVQIKVCGLTRKEDVELAAELGADYFGFIVYPKSPRAISLDRAEELAAFAPSGRHVVVDVETPSESLRSYVKRGFDRYQIHCSSKLGVKSIDSLSGVVGRDQLWLAPRIRPEDSFPREFLSFADTILLDTFSAQQHGGTGETGDWSRFYQLKKAYPNTHFVLAGGLNPDNVNAAISQSQTCHIDVNSGVESSPGIKDSAKLKALFSAVRGAESFR